MPFVYLSEAELLALHDVLTTAEQVDWQAYDRAKARLIEDGRQWHMMRAILKNARAMDFRRPQADTEQV